MTCFLFLKFEWSETFFDFRMMLYLFFIFVYIVYTLLSKNSLVEVLE